MRWYEDNCPAGTRRKKKRFLLLPCKLKRETRWLEFVTIWQEKMLVNYSIDGYPNKCLRWVDIGWADPD